MSDAGIKPSLFYAFVPAIVVVGLTSLQEEITIAPTGLVLALSLTLLHTKKSWRLFGYYWVLSATIFALVGALLTSFDGLLKPYAPFFLVALLFFFPLYLCESSEGTASLSHATIETWQRWKKRSKQSRIGITMAHFCFVSTPLHLSGLSSGFFSSRWPLLFGLLLCAISAKVQLEGAPATPRKESALLSDSATGYFVLTFLLTWGLVFWITQAKPVPWAWIVVAISGGVLLSIFTQQNLLRLQKFRELRPFGGVRAGPSSAPIGDRDLSYITGKMSEKGLVRSPWIDLQLRDHQRSYARHLAKKQSDPTITVTANFEETPDDVLFAVDPGVRLAPPEVKLRLGAVREHLVGDTKQILRLMESLLILYCSVWITCLRLAEL